MSACSEPDCDSTSQIRHGLCSKHYARLTRHGDTRIARVPRPVKPGRYRVKNGQREHRTVLLAKIGPGTHPCHWCGQPVSWDLRWPQSPDALVVDHLDDDKLNNDPSNLVPSHGRCNLTRVRLERNPNGTYAGRVS